MPEILQREREPDLAYHYTPPANGQPTVVFLGGFRSDMQGTKAAFLDLFCQENNLGYLRFDYSGHGQSGGDFKDGTISHWLADTIAMIENVADGPCLLVGSSMGGWIGMLTARRMPARICGFIGIAAAPDFTRDVAAGLSADQKQQMEKQGYAEQPTPYSPDPHIFTKALIEDGEDHCLLDGEIEISAPVSLLQGMDDADVPWQKAVRAARLLRPDPPHLLLVDKADHRFSAPPLLDLLGGEILDMTGQNTPPKGDHATSPVMAGLYLPQDLA